MDLRQIKLFIATAEEKHFSRAARREHIVQSGLSSALKALEEELGIELFTRTTRKVELTYAGKVFLPEAYRILNAFDAARDAINSINGGITGKLAIGTVEVANYFLDIPLLIQQFHEKYPGIRITVKEIYPNLLVEALNNGEIDMAFISTFGDVCKLKPIRSIVSSPLALLLAHDHSLVKSNPYQIKIPDLADETFVDFSSRWGLRTMVDKLFAEENIHRKSEFIVEKLDVMAQFVKYGFGVSILPKAFAEKLGLKALTLATNHKFAPGDWNLSLFTSNKNVNLQQSPIEKIFLNLLDSYLDSNR